MLKQFTSRVITRADNAMTMVHEQRYEEDWQHDELKGEVTLTRAQLQFMVEAIRQLSEEVATLRQDVDKKGEKRPLYRGK